MHEPDERMSLTTKSLRRLKAKSFDKLYAGSVEKYVEMSNTALDYGKRRATAGDKVLLGDVTEILETAVDLDGGFEEHLTKGKLSTDSWAREFAEYILEQVYPQPELKTVEWKKRS
jgi:hypothetical protein